jgi:hypothetical protein
MCYRRSNEETLILLTYQVILQWISNTVLNYTDLLDMGSNPTIRNINKLQNNVFNHLLSLKEPMS